MEWTRLIFASAMPHRRQLFQNWDAVELSLCESLVAECDESVGTPFQRPLLNSKGQGNDPTSAVDALA